VKHTGYACIIRKNNNMRKKKVCVCVCVKNKYHDYWPPWIILMIIKIQSERHRVCVSMIRKIQGATGANNYGPLVSYM
jgi:hypothetical protein